MGIEAFIVILLVMIGCSIALYFISKLKPPIIYYVVYTASFNLEDVEHYQNFGAYRRYLFTEKYLMELVPIRRPGATNIIILSISYLTKEQYCTFFELEGI